MSRVVPEAEIGSVELKNLKIEEATRSPEEDGCALQIVGVSDNKVFVNEENLKFIISKLEKAATRSDTAYDDISVISVVGPLRTGKSFLLDLFIRFLTSHTDDTTKEETPLGWLKDKPVANNQGLFLWRSSKERTTEGIWMYSQPFIRSVKQEDGSIRRVAVLLMDTQGLFDHETDKQTNNTVFGLSTLLSSYQVLNVQNRIQENTLEELHMFIEFCHTALMKFLTAGQQLDDEEPAPSTKFQSLEFLVRDWPHFEDGLDIKQCEKEAHEYIEGAMRQRKHDDGGSRNRIKESYEQVSCFLLPHPGKPMTRPEWNGDLNVVDEEFLVLIDRYVRHLFQESLNTKRSLVPGVQMSPALLFHYITAFVDAFAHDSSLKAENLVTALSRSININARDCALDIYKTHMAKILEAGEFLTDEELHQLHQGSIDASVSEFKKLAAFGPVDDRQASKENLQKQIASEFLRIAELNRTRVGRLLNKYTTFVLVAVTAFMVDWVSDYTCDWWLDLCRDMSWLLWVSYMGIFAFVAWVGYDLYNTKGSVVLWQSLLGLWGDCLVQGNKIYEEIQRNLKAQIIKPKKE